MSAQTSSSLSPQPSEDIMRLRVSAWKREKERKAMIQNIHDQSIKSSTHLSRTNQPKDFTRFTSSTISPPLSDTKVMKHEHGQTDHTNMEKKNQITNGNSAAVERKNSSYTDAIRQRVSAYRFGYGLRTRPSSNNSLEYEEKISLSSDSTLKPTENAVNSFTNENKSENSTKSQQTLKEIGDKNAKSDIKEGDNDGSSMTLDLQTGHDENKVQSTTENESIERERGQLNGNESLPENNPNDNDESRLGSVGKTDEARSAGQPLINAEESDTAALSPEEYREINRQAIINQLSQWKKERIAKGYLKTTNKKRLSAQKRSQKVIIRILWTLIAFQISIWLLCYVFETFFPTSIITSSMLKPMAGKLKYTLHVFAPITYIFNFMYVNIWLSLKAVAESDMSWYEIWDEYVRKFHEMCSWIWNCDEQCVSKLITQSKSMFLANIKNCRSFFSRNVEIMNLELEEKNMGTAYLEKLHDNDAKVKQIKELVATQEAWAMQHLEKSRKERLAILKESNSNLIETKSAVMETTEILERDTANKIEEYSDQLAEKFSQSLREKINQIKSIEAEEVHLQSQGFIESPEYKVDSRINVDEEIAQASDLYRLPISTIICGFALIFGYIFYALYTRNQRRHQRNQFAWGKQLQRGYKHAIRPVVSEDDEETPLLSVYDSDSESSSITNASSSSMMYSATSMSSVPSTKGDFSDFDEDELSYSTSRSLPSQLFEGMSSFLSEELGSMYSSATEMFSSTNSATSMSKDCSQEMSFSANFDDTSIPEFSTSFFSSQLSLDEQSELLENTTINSQSQSHQISQL